MRVLGIAALVIALVTVSAPIHAQQPDPHTQGFRAKLKARYIERRNRFMHKVKDVYFAVGCKVLAREAGIMPLTSPSPIWPISATRPSSTPETKACGR